MNQITTPQLLRLIDVTRLTGLSRSTIYRLQATGDFPKSIQLTVRSVAWAASEVAQWVAFRLAGRDGSAAAGAAS